MLGCCSLALGNRNSLPYKRVHQKTRAVALPYSNAGTGIQDIKDTLRFVLAGTSRGGSVSKAQRGRVEEAQVALESYGGPIDFDRLEGTWEMIYTTAPDVVPLVSPAAQQSPVLRIGSIYQRFSSLDDGRVENVIKLGIPGLLNEQNGVTVTVGARYEARGTRNIVLFFEDFSVGDVHISDALQALVAPAMLPRGWINQQILLAVTEFQWKVPLTTRPMRSLSPSAEVRRGAAAGYYLLTYLDDDMLVGRQQGSGGTFIFNRAP